MRVGIDATYLLTPHKSGVETYTLNLVRALLALPEAPETFLYAAAPQDVSEDAAPLLQAAVRTRVSRVPRLWLRARMPLWMGWDRVQVAHFPGTLLPTWLPCPAVVTFYDMASRRYPELYDPAELGLYETLIPAAARRAAVVLAISEATKRDVVEFLGVAPEKVFVTPLGVDARFAPVQGAADIVARRFGPTSPYVLACVGSGHARKNLRGVVEAFSQLEDRGIHLAIVGAAGRDPAALAAIAASPARERIHQLGHVAEEDLPAIYSAAGVFCFPSLYEGFGLPVLEAMACGTPVVCANASSLPEVAGEAAVMVAPEDTGGIAAALAALMGDEAWRRALSDAGLARAREFTWERCARLTLRAYEAAAGLE